MKVKQLIEKLKEYDQNKDICFVNKSYGYDNHIDLFEQELLYVQDGIIEEYDEINDKVIYKDANFIELVMRDL